jgi:MFS transporter, CP family, cyanate transporter
MRIPILAVSPLLPEIHRSLHLNETLVGALGGLPVFLLAAAAIPGSLLISRIGARRALIAGLLVIAVSSALRGAGPSILALFAATFVLGVGIAVSQPALPTLVRQWAPRNVGLATAVYSNGFLIGEILAAGLTVPLILPLAANHWEVAFALWSVPILIVAIAAGMRTSPIDEDGTERQLWWPDWSDPRTWVLGLIFGCASAAYFGSNAFLPDFLKAGHHNDLVAPVLTALHLGQLPASLMVGALTERLIGRRWPLVVAGLIIVVSALGLALASAPLIFAALLGFGTALVFVLVLALPPLLAPAHDVHRLSAAIFTVTYACPLPAGLVAGAIWDSTGISLAAFLPVVGSGFLLMVLVTRLDLRPRPAS